MIYTQIYLICEQIHLKELMCDLEEARIKLPGAWFIRTSGGK